MVEDNMQRLHPSGDKIKVLYIAGWGRTGSTILDNVLGQVEGFFSVGEINYVWDRNVVENRLCGCGSPFDECEVWRGILNDAFDAAGGIDAHEMIRLRDKGIRLRHIPLMLIPWEGSQFASRISDYTGNLEKLYGAIQARTGSRVVVDSSKVPLYAYGLGMVPNIDLHIVHLVRDPQAVAYSWLRKKIEPDTGTYMPRHNIVRSTVAWIVWNLLIETYRMKSAHRYLRLRYEDFVDRPREAVDRILTFVQEEAVNLPFVGDHRVELKVNHTVGGNPSRFKTGLVDLSLDEEWRSAMTFVNKTVVTALTWPLLLRYGYLNRPGKASS